MSPNDADGMANSVDPDQTAPLGAVWSGSALFAQAYLSENLGSLPYFHSCCYVSEPIALFYNVLHPIKGQGAPHPLLPRGKIFGISRCRNRTPKKNHSAAIIALATTVYVLLFNIIWATSWQNQQNGMRTHRRLRSVWVSAQSDQSLHCPHEESLGPHLPIKCTAKTLIRLGRCPGWSESSLGAHAVLLVLSWDGSYYLFCGLEIVLPVV